MAGSSGKDHILAVEDEPPHRKVSRSRCVSEVDPWDLVETVREGLLVLDSDLTICFANRFLLRHIRSRTRGCDRPEAL